VEGTKGDADSSCRNCSGAGDHGYPLFELLSSNAAVRTESIGIRPKQGWRRNPQSDAPYYRGDNFGMLQFSGGKGERQVALQIIDEHGKVQIEQVLSESDLKTAD
jgi:hypothetical protein